jgi:nucleoid DNA-binding protein
MRTLKRAAGTEGSLVVVTDKEAAEIFGVSQSKIRALETDGYLSPDALEKGKRERYFVVDVKNALDSRAEAKAREKAPDPVDNLFSMSDWRNWTENVLAGNQGLTNREMAIVVVNELKKHMSSFLAKDAKMRIPGLGTFVKKTYPPRDVYVHSKQKMVRVPERSRIVFFATKRGGKYVSENNGNENV